MIDQIKQLLTPYQANGLKRYGGNYDGGYILKEDLVSMSRYVYSYGVGPDESFITFDRDLASQGKDIYLYDASVNFPWWGQEPKFHFKSEYVNSKNILNHVKENGHENETSMILKMDIEGHEFDTIINCDESLFSHFNQVGIEIHDVLNSHGEPECLINADDEKLRWQNKINLFTRLNKYYKLVHIHGNNNSLSIQNGIADVLELTYIRNDCMPSNPEISNRPCPVEGLDFKNSHARNEITMNWWLNL
jgi:hypothetical protein